MPRHAMPSSSAPPRPRRATWRERLFVLGGFLLAALWTVGALAPGAGMETVGAAWLAAVLWTVPASLALALRRGIRDRDWSAFRGGDCDQGREDLVAWSTKTGAYAYLRVAEEHKRLMQGD